MSLKIEELEKKLNDSRLFQGLEQVNRKRKKERFLEDNKKLFNKALELEEKPKTLKRKIKSQVLMAHSS